MKIFIKIILIILISCLAFVVLMYSSDFFTSIIPSWHSVISVPGLKQLIVLCLNIILPLFYLIRFRKLIKSWLFFAYIFSIIFFYYIGYLLIKHFENRLSIDIIAYSSLINELLYLISLTLLSHIIFTLYLLKKLKKTDY
ncbi:uncharacterized membrane protein (DUF485 family) [Flavobacterium sp. W4I14]|nr:uncharacterized membrane protein (DUF485 family) [Flavobacterium sp. W4I14]